MRANRVIVCLLAAAVLAGCASRPINEPIAQVDPKAGYRPYLLIPKRQNNDPHTLFVLSFSGGGTRAAAFSYGVLEELRRTEIVVDGQRRRLIDEVDVITGVSGGSFTALAYALYGDRLFSEYEERFLKRDVQGALVGRTLNPFNWWKFIGGSAGRSELAAELLRRDPVRGRDVRRSARQAGAGRDRDRDRHLDRIAARVLPERLRPALLGPEQGAPVARGGHVLRGPGRAVGGDVQQLRRHLRLSVSGLGAGRRQPRDRAARPSGRALQRYREMQDFQNSKERPYIHLVDGGVSDNIGVRGVLETLEELAASSAFRGEVGFGGIRRIVLIVVNARSSPRTDWDRKRVASRHRRSAAAVLGRADRTVLVRNRRDHEG